MDVGKNEREIKVESKERRKTKDKQKEAERKKSGMKEKKCVYFVDLLASPACPFRYKFRAEIWRV
jgi:hypothetical protein